MAAGTNGRAVTTVKMSAMKIVVVPLLLAVTAIVAVMWVGSRVQASALDDRVSQLVRAAQRDAPLVDERAVAALPMPVQRYLRLALPTPSTAMRLVRLQQRGTIRTDVRSDRWMPFTAEHTAAPHATAFLWNARVAIAPLLHVRVRDSFIGGQGSGHVSLLSAVTIGSDSGTPEMNSGALHRFLAEAVWYPAALLPSEKLRWTAIDEGRALATLTEAATSVSLEFRFADNGEVAGIYTPARWGSFDGGYAQHGWEGHFRGYQSRDGVRLPSEGDVGWYIEGVWRPVWRGTVTDFEITR
jgi:hypothetical protein